MKLKSNFYKVNLQVSTRKKQKESKNSEGFILPEILISLALLMLFTMPFFYFLMTTDITESAQNRTHIFLRDLPDSKVLAQNIKASYMKYFPIAQSTNEMSSIKSCDLLFAHKNFASSSGIPTEEIYAQLKSEMTQASATQISSDLNIPSSIDIHHDKEGKTFMFLGMNSSSTTDPDLLMFDDVLPVLHTYIPDETEGGTTTSSSISEVFPTLFGLALRKSLILGPGVNNIVSNPNQIIATERSLSTPIWKGDLQNFIKYPESFNLSTIASSGINHVLPKSLSMVGNKIIIGAEKNLSKEAYVIDRESGAQVYGVEIGAGVNDVLVKGNLLFVATPKNPEVEVYDITDHDAISPKYVFDAPGSSGNGKSIAIRNRIFFLGRTIGNEEFISLNIVNTDLSISTPSTSSFIPTPSSSPVSSSTSPSSPTVSSSLVQNFFTLFNSFNVDESILSVTPIDNGRVVMLTTNDSLKALMFLKLKQNDPKKYEKWIEIPMPSTVEDYVCDKNSVYVALKSAVNPLIKITF